MNKETALERVQQRLCGDYNDCGEELAVIETALKETDTLRVENQNLKRVINIIKTKLMYEVNPFDFMDYDTYEDYYQNYFEQSFEDEDGEGYPDWWLEKDEFALLNQFFRGKLK